MKAIHSRLERLPSQTKKYFSTHLKADAIAGLTVAVMGVPQAMAYAVIAELPPIYGLYTAMITCVVAALFGSSHHLVTGPTNAICMVILSLVAHLPEKYGLDRFEIVLLLTFMVGAIQLSLGLLRLGGIIKYVSHAVVIGFTAGAGILIAFNQIKNLIGIQFQERPEHFYQVIGATFQQIGNTNPYALAVGILTIALVIVVPRLNAKLPRAFIAVVVSGAFSYLLGWHEPSVGEWRVEIVKDLEPIQASFANMIHFPDTILSPNFELAQELSLGAVALAVLGLIEAASIARAVASQSGQRLDFNREFIGQGAGNLVGSFFSSFAGSGSFTRTAVNFKSGAATRMAAVFSALWTALTILLLADVANYIPKASLAGILIVIAYTMIDKQRLVVTWRSTRNSRIVLFGTLASTLVLPLEYAIIVGVSLSLILLLRTTGTTDLTQLVFNEDSTIDEVPFNRAPESEVVTVNMEGDLYFAAAEDLDYELLSCITPKTRVVILRMKRLRTVGSTAMAILEHFWQILKERDLKLVVCGIEEDLKKVMTGSGLRNRIGEQNIFYADNRLFQSTELALARARSMVEMERNRKLSDAPAPEAEPDKTITAKQLLTPRLLRFGNQHQLREATWLVSEMYKHIKTKAARKLFLQDREGKLYGGLNLWTLLKALGSSIKEDEATTLNEDVLSQQLRTNFHDPITDLCQTDLPRLTVDTPLHELVSQSIANQQLMLAILNESGQITGVVTQMDLLRGIGRLKGFNPEKELPKV
ncbi:SulP family inorganic anion transporter [Pelagicoccus enzymogenes]|uniref:SulP family inorganic anion transporter n=1 Tax=Pelagicoccus enzymogenes TaxID=2773457 RepID=UPI00280E7A7D|nr:SulP family inorganic anion transporter [Pelagicoccus enzymogenes]MDQ8198873.1 SulP family inorganic anion transporter [Pelagicoccus enzymogenes]